VKAQIHPDFLSLKLLIVIILSKVHEM